MKVGKALAVGEVDLYSEGPQRTGGTLDPVTMAEAAVEHVLVLAYGDTAAAEVRADARFAASQLLEWLKSMSRRVTPAQPHYALLLSMIEGAREDGAFVRRKDVAQLPPGSPI